MQTQSRSITVVILGAGSIGLSFAAVLSDAGAQITLVDPNERRRSECQQGLLAQSQAIQSAKLMRNAQGSVAIVEHPGDALQRADLVIECGPENLDIKQAIFEDLLAKTKPGCILTTASSAIPMSRIVPTHEAQNRCLVAHPVNPPAVLRVIELVPAPGTLEHTVSQAAHHFEGAGFTTVKLGKEIEGFVLNRLQGAVLREAYRLVDEGVTNVAGVDAIMTQGLGPRWALSGPFETAELNTPGGITSHADRMGPAYKRMGEARGETVNWHEDLIATVTQQRRAILPAHDLPARSAWRARAVAELIAARDKLLQSGKSSDADDA